MDKPNFGPWKIWNGGERPTDGMVQVHISSQTRMEAMHNAIRESSTYTWRHYNGTGDIIAYREVIEPPKPASVWINEYVGRDGGVYLGDYVYKSRSGAETMAGVDCLRQVELREVPE